MEKATMFMITYTELCENLFFNNPPFSYLWDVLDCPEAFKKCLIMQASFCPFPSYYLYFYQFKDPEEINKNLATGKIIKNIKPL